MFTLPMHKRINHNPTRTTWSIALLTIGLVGLAVIAASDFSWRFTGVRTLVSSLGQSFTVQTEQTETTESISTAPGLTLIKHDNGYVDARQVESEVYTPERAFSAIGARWHAAIPAGTELSLAVRTGTDTSWSDWQPLYVSEDAFVAHDPTARVSDLVFVEPSSRLQFFVELATTDPAITPRLEDIRFDLMDPNPGPQAPEVFVSAAGATANQPAIISRAQWGANESLMTWAPERAAIKQIIVHHTAGSNGGTDPAAVIRGIYQYHAQTLGWGDIGYNFLIDPQGRIYTGRSGGWGTIGAHALGYNTGSIGIALLGTYESSPATSQAENALIQLSGFIAAKYDLDPTLVHTFINKQVPTLSGHRDVGQTLCPGTVEHARLPAIRTAALNARSSYYAGTYSGTLAEITGHVLSKNTAGQAEIKVRNTGSGTWTSSGANPVVLQTIDPTRHASPLFTTGWTSQFEPGTMQEDSVGPNQTATFMVPLAAADLGDTTDTFIVVRKGAAAITGTKFTVTRSVREDYQGQVVGLKDPINVEGGQTVTIDVRIKNTGAKTWTNTGATPAAINLTQPTGRVSGLRSANWPLSYRPTLLDSEQVLPDQEGLFSMQFDMPAQAGEFFEPMQAVIDNVTFIPGTEFTLHIVAANPYQSELEERPIVIFASPDEQRDVVVNLTNRSSKVWRGTGNGFVALELKNQASSMLRASTWVSPSRPMTVPHEIGPGGVASLQFPIKAPAKAGEYRETYHLVSDGQTAIDGSTFSINVVVRPALAAQLLTKDHNVSVKAQQSGRLTVELKNIGAKTWQADGKDALTVVTNKPLKHESNLASDSWPNAFTPTKLEPPVVAPDQIARLSIEVAPGIANGQTTDNFTLLDSSGAPVTGSAFTVTRTTSGVAESGPEGQAIRVGIYNSGSKISVDAASGYTVIDAAGATLGSAGSGKTEVRWNGSTYVVTGAVSGSSNKPIRFVPTGATIFVLPDYEDRPTWNPSLNDNAFRGVIEVRRASNGTLHAINELPLEQYMRGLGEASNESNTAYLKVLAIAARTYAEYHRQNGGKHPAEGFDVDNKNDQVYKGYNLEQRNQTFVDAVNATRGKFVTYKGAVVVTPYFSRSDGHTRAFHEVFGGEVKPWLVRVEVPENNGKTLLGHGVGLDASAALARTAAGQSVEKVLKAFYTGTAVSKLY